MTTKLSLSDIEYWQKQWPKDEATETAFEMILTEVNLFLADWGYNTIKSHELVKQDSTINLLSLDTFSQDFSEWIK